MAMTVSLSACGGGGESVRSMPAPPPVAPTPSLAPRPNPSPSGQGYDDAEYARSTSAVAAGAKAAYDNGATGQGVKIAIIDTGVNAGLPEFAGRIDGASRDLVGDRGVSDVSGHGTAVAALALGARNGAGMHGVAFSATLLSLNVSSLSDCSFASCAVKGADIARGIDAAVDAKAKVINLSIGSPDAEPQVIEAVRRAAQAGIVVVVSGGNAGAPDPSGAALQMARAGDGLVLIAGSHEANGAIRTASNRAGTGAASFLAALGGGVNTIGADGSPVTSNGTSLAAPAISGAAALLSQAFPNLSGRQIVDLLVRSATDAGEAGRDEIYGNGLLNLTRAFQPQGALTLAGSRVAAADLDLIMSSPMGDAGSSLAAVMLDDLGRVYLGRVGARFTAAGPEPLLLGAGAPIRSASGGLGAVSFSMAVTGKGSRHAALIDRLPDRYQAPSRLVSSTFAARIGPGTAVAFGAFADANALAQQLGGRPAGPFLAARDVRGRPGFVAFDVASAALRRVNGRTGLTLTAERGTILHANAAFQRKAAPYTDLAVTVDRHVGLSRLSLGVSRIDERETMLGSRSFGALAGSARTFFLDAHAIIELDERWSVAGSFRHGSTRIAGHGGLVKSGLLATNAWSVDLTRRDAIASGNQLMIRLAAPLRVDAENIPLLLPASYDHQSGATSFTFRRLGLVPRGRELDVELAYVTNLLGGSSSINMFVRRQPGHIHNLSTDVGAMFRWGVAF